MPQFGSNLYNNPQMGSYGGGGSYGLYPPGFRSGSDGGPRGFSPAYANWYQSFTPSGGMWQNYGEVPGYYGMESSYNPVTGEWGRRSSDVLAGYYGNQNAIRSIDPRTGETYINPGALSNLFGASGGAGYQGYEMTDYGGPQVTPGAGYEGFDYSTVGSGIDPGAVIAAQEPRLQETMEADMAQAAARAGQSGFAMSTPYTAELGSAARKAAQDRAALTMQYQYDAAQAQAMRDLQQQLQAAQLDFSGWQTGYQGDLTAQQANQQAALQQWMLENQLGFQGSQQENLFNQQNQMMQYQMLASLLGGLL